MAVKDVENSGAEAKNLGIVVLASHVELKIFGKVGSLRNPYLFRKMGITTLIYADVVITKDVGGGKHALYINSSGCVLNPHTVFVTSAPQPCLCMPPPPLISGK